MFAAAVAASRLVASSSSCRPIARSLSSRLAAASCAFDACSLDSRSLDPCSLDACRLDACRLDACRLDLCRLDACRLGPCSLDPCGLDLQPRPVQPRPVQPRPVRPRPVRPRPLRPRPLRPRPLRPRPLRPRPLQPRPLRPRPLRPRPLRPRPLRPRPLRPRPLRPRPLRPRPLRPRPLRPRSLRPRPCSLNPCGLNLCGLYTLSFLACSLPPRSLLHCRCLPRGLLAFGLLARGLDPYCLRLHPLLLRLPLGTIEFCKFVGSLRCLLIDSRPRWITSISKRRHRGLRTRGVWRCGDHRRWPRWSGRHDQCGLVGPLHGDHSLLRDRCGRRVTGPFGAQRRIRRRRTGRGVWLGLVLGFVRGVRHDRFCRPAQSRRGDTEGVRAGPSATGCPIDARIGSLTDVPVGSVAVTCAGTTTTRRSATSTRRSCQGKPKPGNHPWPPKIRLNSHVWISSESSSAYVSGLRSGLMRWLSARRWNVWNSSVLRRRCSGTAGGAGDGTMSYAPVDLTEPPVMTLPKHLGDIREPHPVHCHIHTDQTWGSILTCPNEPSTPGEPLRTEATRQ